MSGIAFYHTGILEITKDSPEIEERSWIRSTYSNAEISVSPEYITHKNILSNEINILKGYFLSVSLEMYFLSSDETYYKVDEIIEILNSIKTNSNGILGINSPIYVRFLNENGFTLKEFALDKLGSDILLTDYVGKNMNIGQKFDVKLNSSELLQDIPLWSTYDDTYTNGVLGIASRTIATDEDWI